MKAQRGGKGGSVLQGGCLGQRRERACTPPCTAPRAEAARGPSPDLDTGPTGPGTSDVGPPDCARQRSFVSAPVRAFG